MPAIPPGLGEWLPSGAVIAFGMFLFGLVRADMKAMETRLREDMKAGEARQREDLKDGLGKLEAKLDRLIESRLPTTMAP